MESNSSSSSTVLRTVLFVGMRGGGRINGGVNVVTVRLRVFITRFTIQVLNDRWYRRYNTMLIIKYSTTRTNWSGVSISQRQ